MLEKNPSDDHDKEKIVALEQEVEQLTHLSRLLAKCWRDADEFVWKSAQSGFVDIGQYPTVQGTGNQLAMGRIAQQSTDNKKALLALKRLDAKD